eukprot:1459227-Pleurochrysis_carterae.AAC.1
MMSFSTNAAAGRSGELQISAPCARVCVCVRAGRLWVCMHQLCACAAHWHGCATAALNWVGGTHERVRESSRTLAYQYARIRVLWRGRARTWLARGQSALSRSRGDPSLSARGEYAAGPGLERASAGPGRFSLPNECLGADGRFDTSCLSTDDLRA